MGAAAPELVSSPRRLRTPLKRVNPKDAPEPEWREISWDDALEALAGAMRGTRERYGAEAVAFSRPTTSANGSVDWNAYLFRLANRFGTPNVHTTSYLCQWNRDEGLKHTYGVGLPNPEFENAALAIVCGHNPALTNPMTLDRLRTARRGGTKIVVIDPRRSETTKFADLWLAPRYGTDGALMLGALRHLLAAKEFDYDFTAAWTNAPFLVDRVSGRFLRGAPGTPRAGHYAVVDENHELRFLDPTRPPSECPFEPQLEASLHSDESLRSREALEAPPAVGSATAFLLLREQVAPYTLDRVVATTGLPAEDIRSFYRLIATARPSCYYTWNGWEQHANSYYTHRAMAVLYALTGSFDARGGNVIYPSLELEDLQGGSFLSPTQAGKRLGLEAHPLGAATYSSDANSFYRAALEGKPYPLRVLVSFGSNMLLQNPDSDRGRSALRSLDYHAHIDLFETPMAGSADLLLPAAHAWESPGLRLGFGGGEDTARHAQYRPPVVSPAGDARPDIDIIFDLAERLGYGDDFWSGDVLASFDARLAPHGLRLDQLAARPEGMRVPGRVGYRKHELVDPSSGRVRGFATPTRKIEVYAERLLDYGYEPLPVYVAPSTSPASNEALARDYPLVLSSNKLRVMVHSQHRGTTSLRRRWPEPFVEVHPLTASTHSLEDGEWARIETAQGAMRVKVVISSRVQEGVVVGQAGWWEGCPELGLPGHDPFSDDGANYNRLISIAVVDVVSGGVPMKSYHCRLVKLPAPPED